MIARTLMRLAQMDRAEIAWRGTVAARILLDRARTRMAPPRWSRAELLPALASTPELTTIRRALADRNWEAAQRELSRHFATGPQRFAIGPRSRAALVERVRRDFPEAAGQAARRADRIVHGDYDLLAYRGLRFGEAALPDWHCDPVNGRTAPRQFWATVPYLDPVCGDHKVIWELNRHQHWIALGRAYWLTDDRRYRDRVLAELESWLEANPPLMGVNWASMLELAFRSISWIWAIQFFAEDAGSKRTRPTTEADSPWLVDLLIALERQLTHIEHNLSHYFSPNTHLLGEALALYLAGRALPELRAAERWTATGRRILIQEIDRQIAADGGHCERSTHYHRYTLDFYALALISARQTGDDVAIARFEDAVTRLGGAARLLADDNGRVPHIGDDDAGALTPITGREPDDLRDSLAIAAALTKRPDLQIGAAPEEAPWMLGELSALSPQPSALSSGALPETGYFVSRSSTHHLVIDGGPHGYQNGGHAHADALSVTLGVRGVPLLIDPGTGCYTTDAALRDRMRSSVLHNTLTLDDRSQSLSRGPFHWSHVANAEVHRWRTHEGWDYFDGSQNGYHPIEHRRRVLSAHGDLLVVADFVGTDGSHAAATHWHLDPQWTVDARARGAVFTREGDRVGLTIPHGVVSAFAGDADTGLGFCSPAYGRVERTTTVRISHTAAAPFWVISVFDLDPDNAVSDVDWLPVWAEAGVLEHAAAIRITRATSVDHVLFAEPGGHAGPPPQSNLVGRPAQANVVGRPAQANVVGRPAQANVVGAGLRAGALWRIGDVETDARMLFLRAALGRPLACLAAVDGTTARTKNLELLNLRTREPLNPDCVSSPCAALPVS